VKGLLVHIVSGIYELLWNIFLLLLKFYSHESQIGKWYQDHNESKKKIARNETRPLFFFACSSVGEYKRIETIAKHYSELGFGIEISFFSPSGYNFLNGLENKWDKISFLPFDRKKDVQTFFQSTNPHYVFISSNMIWPNFIRELDRNKIAYSIVGCSYYRNGYFNGLFLSFKLLLIKRVEHAFCIDQNTHNLLSQYLAPDQIIVTGDPRLDSIFQSSNTKINQSLLTQFKNDKKLLIIGSAYTEEVKIIIESYNTLLNAGYRVVIAPHELGQTQNIIYLLESSSIEYDLYSKGECHREILVLDKMGILRDAYAMAEIAFIGGGWKKGIHNIVEAMVHGCTIVSGPKFMKFPEARYLKRSDLLHVISNKYNMKTALENERSLPFQSKKQRSYKEWIEENNQANEIILSTLNEVI
jgi:3-deoxy-D-manno-octulosonic-acid transferase